MQKQRFDVNLDLARATRWNDGSDRDISHEQASADRRHPGG
jgi:hypothetical protein